MPLYEYKCDNCGTTFEVIQRFSDPPVEKCKNCSGPVHKVLSAPAIQFKGSGWYVTDYAKKSMTDAGKSNSEATSSVSSSDTKTESKSETKSETKSSSTDKK